MRRDLKPENILLDYTGHIALCDFGLCKLNMSESDTTNSEFTSFSLRAEFQIDHLTLSSSNSLLRYSRIVSRSVERIQARKLIKTSVSVSSLAPELLSGHGYTKCVDWWTLGVLLYEMVGKQNASRSGLDL